jgi:hypothetical protein
MENLRFMFVYEQVLDGCWEFVTRLASKNALIFVVINF